MVHPQMGASLMILGLVLMGTACTQDTDDPTADNGAVNNQTPDSGSPDTSIPDTSTPEDTSADPQDTDSPGDVPEEDASPGDDTLSMDDVNDQPDTPDEEDWVPPCEAEPCPMVIDRFPFTDARDTQTSINRFDRYSCAPNTNESGPEFAYIMRIDEPGFILAGVTDGSSVDIDLHLLDALDPDACLARNDEAFGLRVTPGIHYLIADTWVNSGGNALPGPFEMTLNFIPDSGPCGMVEDAIPRIGADDLLTMPATGPVVLEAHLLTAEEHEENIMSGMELFPQEWPQSFTDGIEHHYEISQAASGFVTDRNEPWAPCCEPSNEFAQGSSVKPPAEAEAWYINMRWRNRPERGERYIVLNPFNGKAVVGAAGYENGPGNVERIGGAAEEIHIYFGSRHLDTMTFGVATDQTLPFGPIDCNNGQSIAP